MDILRGYDSSYKNLLSKHIDICNQVKNYGDSKVKTANFIYIEHIGTGILLYNTITGMFIEMNNSEFEYVTSLTYKKLIRSEYKVLIENHFIIPETFDESPAITEIINEKLAENKELNPDNTNSYIIFTTMDCNARCFYCYEKGAAAVKMTEKTANDIADFILERFKNSNQKDKDKKGIKLSWFGGEPLYNASVIDIITDRIAKENIPYNASIISNGSLINEELVCKFVNKWYINNIQITIDGTPDVYNKIKNYKDPEFRKLNPFKVIIKNIKHLLNAGIKVAVRMNVGAHNADDLMELIKILNREIGVRKNFTVYAHRLFDNVNGHVRTREENAELYKKLEQIRMFLHYYGYLDEMTTAEYGVKNKYCMSDSGGSLCITPTGKLTVCEHHHDDCIIGDIYEQSTPDKWNKEELDSWKERKEYKRCISCPLRTMCLQLTKCADTDIECDDIIQKDKLTYFGYCIRALYKNIKSGNRNNNSSNGMIEKELARIVNELELANDYKSLTLWERIKILFGMDVWRDPHKNQQDNFNGK